MMGYAELTHPKSQVEIMHPNSYLNNFWRLDRRNEIFVAMSFDERYKQRFTDIIKPAIESINIEGQKIKAVRVDASKTGDSIITEIMDGISHSILVLADISSVGKDSVSGNPYRNGNVMYEVGVALASRQPQEVLLLRDDSDNFLFDVSTIPHMTVDFVDKINAVNKIQSELEARLKESKYVLDSRVEIASASLTNQELLIIKELINIPEDQIRGW